MNGTKTYTILSVEDTESDFELLEDALNKIPDLSLNIINANDGQKGLDFIYKKNDYVTAPTPSIIILDINLPLVSGKEILKILKKDEILKKIPIIIFSTSNSNSDIEESYQLYANSYITKSFDIESLFNKIANIGEYWLKISELPYVDDICFINKK